MDWLSARLEALQQEGNAGTLDRERVPNPPELIERLELELAHQLGTMALAATYPGPGLPPGLAFGDTEPTAPPLPAWAVDIDPLDLFLLHQAFLEANVGRMEALEQIVPPDRGRPLLGPKSPAGAAPKTPMSWNVFIGTMATRLKEDPVRLARDRSLVALLAQVRLGAVAMAEETAAEGMGL